jgi:hypothetical protein
MRNDSKVISTHELDADKKDNITRYALEKMLKEIKIELQKRGKLRILIEKI